MDVFMEEVVMVISGYGGDCGGDRQEDSKETKRALEGIEAEQYLKRSYCLFLL